VASEAGRAARVPLRAALVGYGYAGRTLHAPLLRATDGLELAAVVSRQPATVGADGPTVRVFDRLEALLADGSIDLVVIASPNELHHPQALAALRAGCHVVVDKPFTVTAAEAESLIAEAGARARVLSVFHNRRWDADFLTLRGLLAGGDLGRVTSFVSRFDRFRPVVRDRWRERPVPGGGIWNDLGPHLLDQALQLFGWPEALQADLAVVRDDATADDQVEVVLRYPRCRVVLGASMLRADTGSRFEVHGTTGSYRKAGLDPQEEMLKRGLRPGDPGFGVDAVEGQVTREVAGRAVVEPRPNAVGDWAAFYRGVVRAIRLGEPPPVAAADALAVMQLIELGRRSAAAAAWLATGHPPPGATFERGGFVH
jgi:predicted dehydrogenase